MAQAIARKVLVVGGSGFLGESKWQRVEKKKKTMSQLTRC
jgi:NAD dependent epimerase/dehydratase family enzyme